MPSQQNYSPSPAIAATPPPLSFILLYLNNAYRTVRCFTPALSAAPQPCLLHHCPYLLLHHTVCTALSAALQPCLLHPSPVCCFILALSAEPLCCFTLALSAASSPQPCLLLHHLSPVCCFTLALHHLSPVCCFTLALSAAPQPYSSQLGEANGCWRGGTICPGHGPSILGFAVRGTIFPSDKQITRRG